MRSVASCALALALAACGPSVNMADDVGDDVVDARVDAPGIDGANSDADVLDFSKVYAHSGTVLYRLDTMTLQPVMIGPFNLASGSITDIAVDRNDRMLGVSFDNIYTINVATGAATLLVAAGTTGLTSLSFVPMDLNNPNSPERLVAATDTGDVVEINQTTGATTVLGNYGTVQNGDQIKSSGDIVAVSGLGIFATVTVGTPLSNPDYLAQINPATWQATLIGGGTGYDKIFGLGFWRDKLYGFVDVPSPAGGAIIELAPNTGVVTPVNTGTIRWFGAGVTTDAPVIN